MKRLINNLILHKAYHNSSVTNILKENVWIHYPCKFKFNLLSKYSIENSLTEFWDNIMNKLHEDKFVYLRLRIKNIDNDYKTFGLTQKVNNTNLNELIELYQYTLNFKTEDYITIPLEQIFVSYKIIPDAKIKSKISKISSSKKQTEIGTFTFGGFKLPNTMDFTKWGNIIYSKGDDTIIQKDDSKEIYIIIKNIAFNLVQIKIKNKLILEFKDYIVEGNKPNTFIRIVKDQEYKFIDGELIVKIINRKTKFIKTIKMNRNITNKFLTLDIETRTIDNIIKPFCICYFDGINSFSFYLSDYKNEELMLKEAILSLFNNKYKNYIVYIHNLSFFDGIFLIKALSSIENMHIRPLMKDGKIFNIELSFNKIKLSLRDSLLMLPISLSKLANAFKVEDKGIYPYDFINSNELNYIGKVPNFNYFKDISLDSYNNYSKSFKLAKWNLRKVTIDYCIQDCLILYQIINKFNLLIFDHFKINIHKYATLSSLALGIYRSNYLKDHKIPIITGKMFLDLKQSYTGGSTDMFLPHGDNILAYDVNSLYPTVMRNQDMPIGLIRYFEGDIRKVDQNAFGFFEVEITSPENIQHPIIQTRVDTGNGLRTISPLGNWKDLLFSAEMDNAINLGYKFKIIRGYLFQKGKIFIDYINDLYLIKQSHSKDHALYLIAKLFLNSLYGKLAMDYRFDEHAIVHDQEIDKMIENNYLISEIINLDNQKSLISFHKDTELTIMNDSFEGDSTNQNISIGIGSAVTAYSRIFMSKFKNNEDYKLYYTDTDSIYIDKELSPEFVGGELGQFKLENIFKEAIFLGPKVYGGISENGIELTKVKGYKDHLKYSDLKTLLVKDKSLELIHEKWFRNISEGNIKIKNQIYTLLPTENKRKLIYVNSILNETKPFVIDINKKIIVK
jgi:hypothetical protein